MRNRLALATMLLLLPASHAQGSQSTDTPQSTQANPTHPDDITYTNTQYSFRLRLPPTWKGFVVITGEQWGGAILSDNQSQTVQEVKGPMLRIRHPRWTEAVPREDIPIMIFTHAQWKMVVDDRLGIGAAPIPPSELGRNARYVFALPARYNFDYSLGWKQVEKILAAKPLHGF